MTDHAINDHTFAMLLQQGKLQGSKCTACDAVFVPPRSLCPNCHQADMRWVLMAGTGRLLAFTCISIGPPWMVAQGYDRDHPYCSAAVELDEGPRVVARIEGVDAEHPESIQLGMRLVAQLGERGESDDASASLVFTPA
ncbi:MAG: hypothetical protein CMJ64_16825 [Planctomycetaceae bacterium]|nr:hypothetical protein [Planctomycetaceae bacterium]